MQIDAKKETLRLNGWRWERYEGYGYFERELSSPLIPGAEPFEAGAQYDESSKKFRFFVPYAEFTDWQTYTDFDKMINDVENRIAKFFV